MDVYIRNAVGHVLASTQNANKKGTHTALHLMVSGVELFFMDISMLDTTKNNE